METGRRNHRPSDNKVNKRVEDYKKLHYDPKFDPIRWELTSRNEGEAKRLKREDKKAEECMAAHESGTFEFEGYPNSIFEYVETKFEELHDLFPAAKMYTHLIEAPEVYVMGWDEWCDVQHSWIQRHDFYTNLGSMSKHLEELKDRKDVHSYSIWTALINEAEDGPCHPFLETFAKVGL
jgi:hypothetical protein